MEYSEFTRLLGADPSSQDPAFLKARESSPEFRAAAAEAKRFENRLNQALAAKMPDDLNERLLGIPQFPAGTDGSTGVDRRWWPLALAASLLIAVGSAGLVWRLNTGWDSVPQYVAEHYRHDGEMLLGRSGGTAAAEARGMLAEFGVQATPELMSEVTVVKNCPTPDGKGVHMVLSTQRGLITVLYMPATDVTDGEQLTFDGLEGVLVALESGSAAIVGAASQQVKELHSFVQQSIVPLAAKT